MDWNPSDRSRIDALRSGVGRFVVAVRRLAFWTAVALPVLYLPPLIAGPASTTELAAVGVLVALHVAAILVGHDYRRPGRDDEATG